jgi:hypothetical protein
MIYVQVQIGRLGQPFGECVDTSTGQHDVVKNVYEELFPDTYYSVAVSQTSSVIYSRFTNLVNGYRKWIRRICNFNSV